MRNSSLSYLASITALATLLPLATVSSRAASSPTTLDAYGAVLAQAHADPMDWNDAKRHKLREAFWLLEGGNKDYGGHRLKAMEEIKKAGAIMGLDLHGDGYGGKRQEWSDKRLREARALLEDVVDRGGHREHEHIREAIHEIDKSLEWR